MSRLQTCYAGSWDTTSHDPRADGVLMAKARDDDMAVRNRANHVCRQLLGRKNRDVEEPAGSMVIHDPDEPEVGALQAGVSDLRHVASAVENDPLLTRGVYVAPFRDRRKAAANLLPGLRVQVDGVFQVLPGRASARQPAAVIR
jgi:hypothetical protein